MEPGVTLFHRCPPEYDGGADFSVHQLSPHHSWSAEFQDRKQIEFQWVGAPGYVEPIFIRCFEDRIEYFDLFKNTNRGVELDS